MKLHSYLSHKCEAKKIKGKWGIFAKMIINKNELVAIWGGKIFSEKDILRKAKKHPNLLTHPVSVYEGYFLGPTSFSKMDDVEYMNHSCDPNVGIKGQIILLARRRIKKNEELCFDYETTEICSEKFMCDCGSEKCRKIISGNSWKSKKFQKQNRGYFSWYIEQKIKNLNSKRKQSSKKN